MSRRLSSTVRALILAAAAAVFAGALIAVLKAPREEIPRRKKPPQPPRSEKLRRVEPTAKEAPEAPAPEEKKADIPAPRPEARRGAPPEEEKAMPPRAEPPVPERVYACSEAYKFRPDGTVIDFGAQLPGRLKESNAVWSAPDRLVRLAGARGETVAFTLVVPEKGSFRARVKGPGPFEGSKLSLVAWVEFRGEFFPDVVVPCPEEFSVPYGLPGLRRVDGQEVGLLLVEVPIPRDCPEGEFRGGLVVSGGINESVGLNLRVFPLELPARPTVLLDVNSYGSPARRLGKGHRDPYSPAPEETLAVERRFYRCANEHRAYLNVMPVHSQRGKPYYAPPLEGAGASTRVKTWEYFDARFGSYLDGSAFSDGDPVPSFYLPFNLHWPRGYSHDASLKDNRFDFRKNPADLEKTIDADYVGEWEATAKDFVRHFAEKGWKGTVFQVYLNHSRKENALSPWRLDEPYDRNDFNALAFFARLTRRAFANRDGLVFKYRLDIGHYYCRTPTMRCYKAKRYEPDRADLIIEPAVDVWYVGTTHSYGNREKLAELRKKRPELETWTYGGGQSVKTGGAEHVALAWYMFDLGQKGFCFWNEGACDPSEALAKEGGDHVWYLDKLPGEEGPYPSLRMKLWRRGSFDVEYLGLAAERAPEKAKAVLSEMCGYARSHPRYKVVMFPAPNNNPEDWVIARTELALLALGEDATKLPKRRGRIEGAPSGPLDQITGY